MTFTVWYKYLNCAVGKTIDTNHIINCDTNYKIILLIMLFITSWYKPFKICPFRDICTYATSVKPSFAK